MLARLVQRWSLVEGGSLPGSTKAPITPPSNRIVSPGQSSRWSNVAARSGMPAPASSTCPFLSSRALKIVSSSAAVWLHASVIVDAPPLAGRIEDLLEADEVEEPGPGLRPVDVAVEVFLHAADRVLVHEADEVLHVPHH